MPDDERQKAPESKDNSLDKVKNNQQLLKNQIKQLEEGLSTPKVYSFQTEELREMVQTLLTQNKRLAEKVDYLLSILVEASSEMSDDVYDKTLAAMAKSQVDMIDQLSKIRERTESGQTKADELDKAYKSSEQKLKLISDSISQISYAKQFEDLKANVNAISSDIQKLGSVVTAQTPELKGNIDSLRTELEQLKLKVSDIGMFRGDVKDIERKLTQLEATLSSKEQKSVAELSEADRGKIQALSQKLLELNTEVTKMEKIFESYPSSEAQDITSIKQKLIDIEHAVNSINQGPQDQLSKELQGLKSKIISLENTFEQKELDMEAKREAEMQVISGILKKIESDLETLGGSQATQLSAVLSELNEKTKQMTEGLQNVDTNRISPRYFEDLRKEVMTLGVRLGRIEDYVKKEKVADYSHVSDIKTEVTSIRKELEAMRGMKVKPEVISRVRENICNMEAPAAKVIGPIEREKIVSIRDNISRTQEMLKPIPPMHVRDVTKGLKGAEEKVNNIMKEINHTEQGIIEKREDLKKLRGDVLNAPLRREDMVANYVLKMPVHVPVKIRDIAGLLNMDRKDVQRMLLRMKKEKPGVISLANMGYLSRLFGKDPILMRLQ